MNKETQSYWFTDTGEWGSNEVETITFEGHHENIHEAFEFVQDWELPDWAAWLSKRPHERTGALDDWCKTCEELSEEFGVM